MTANERVDPLHTYTTIVQHELSKLLRDPGDVFLVQYQLVAAAKDYADECVKDAAVKTVERPRESGPAPVKVETAAERIQREYPKRGGWPGSTSSESIDELLGAPACPPPTLARFRALEEAIRGRLFDAHHASSLRPPVFEFRRLRSRDVYDIIWMNEPEDEPRLYRGSFRLSGQDLAEANTRQAAFTSLVDAVADAFIRDGR